MKRDTFTPKTVSKVAARGPGTKGVLPRYVAKGNSKKVAYTRELWPGEVYGDFNDKDELIGVEIL